MSSTEIDGMLLQLWKKSQGTVMARIDLIEEASRALEAGQWDVDLCQRAKGAAHKLAGILGTFGFPEGSRLASNLETLLETAQDQQPDNSDELRRLIAGLRSELRP